MPTYDYKCKECDHLFEVLQGINDDKFTKCPECSKESLQRLIGRGGMIVFKGSGFFETDYNNKNTRM